jgi:hypothetical protein
VPGRHVQHREVPSARLATTRRSATAAATRIIDDLVFWGDLDTIVEKLHAHVVAGADHVGVQVIGIERGRAALPYWRLLGEALLPKDVGAAGA